MYVDFNIPVCDKLPKRILDDIALLDKYYKEEDVCNYLLLEDSVEADIKNCCEQHIITGEEFKQMFRRFGWL